VYVADNGNATIRKYDPATATVSTIAGAAGFGGGNDGDAIMQARFVRPEGVFLDGHVLYISDGSASTIRALDLTTNQVTTLAGQYGVMGTTDGSGSSARLGYPLYITGDHNGKLYVADSIPGIRELTIATGALKTVAGNATTYGHMDGAGGAAQFGGVYGMAIENGALYILDSQPGQFVGLRKMTLDGTYTVSSVAGGATIGIMDGAPGQFLGPAAATGDGMGHVYIGDVGVLRRFDVSSGMITTVAGKPYVVTDQPGPLASAYIGTANGIAVLTGGDVVIDDALESLLLRIRLPPP
jgi:hypothetical protein